MNIAKTYFSEVTGPCTTGCCLHLLSDILMIDLCTYLTVGTDYEDMRMFALEHGSELGDYSRYLTVYLQRILSNVYSVRYIWQDWNIVCVPMARTSQMVCQKRIRITGPLSVEGNCSTYRFGTKGQTEYETKTLQDGFRHKLSEKVTGTLMWLP